MPVGSACATIELAPVARVRLWAKRVAMQALHGAMHGLGPVHR